MSTMSPTLYGVKYVVRPIEPLLRKSRANMYRVPRRRPFVLPMAMCLVGRQQHKLSVSGLSARLQMATPSNYP